VDYVRVHDDIGWTFSDEDAAALGIKGSDHRQFLNEFYRGRFDGSFARGLPFQENPKTGDCRISGTCASLAGLEKAIYQEGPTEIEFAIRRILLIYGVVLTVGGIPLIYLGDEIATLNDYSYLDDPAHARDSRWVHRSRADWTKYAKRNDRNAIEGRVFQGFQNLIKLRKDYSAFSGGELEIVATGNDHVLGYKRSYRGHCALVVANFSEQPQTISLFVGRDYSGDSLRRIYGASQPASRASMTVEPLDFLALELTN
jgi:amylosucrase